MVTVTTMTKRRRAVGESVEYELESICCYHYIIDSLLSAVRSLLCGLVCLFSLSARLQKAGVRKIKETMRALSLFLGRFCIANYSLAHRTLYRLRILLFLYKFFHLFDIATPVFWSASLLVVIVPNLRAPKSTAMPAFWSALAVATARPTSEGDDPREDPRKSH